jgi:hypothetical protein
MFCSIWAKPGPKLTFLLLKLSIGYFQAIFLTKIKKLLPIGVGNSVIHMLGGGRKYIRPFFKALEGRSFLIFVRKIA